MKRWPVIRHIRFWYLSWRVHRHAAAWAQCGIGVGGPNPADLDHLAAIWYGKA